MLRMAVIFFFASGLSEQDSDQALLADIMIQQQVNFAALTSLDVSVLSKYTFEETNVEVPKGAFNLHEIRFRFQAEKWRTDFVAVQTIDPERTVGKRIGSYNGQTYYSFNDRAGLLEMGPTLQPGAPPYVTAAEIFLPYMFAFNCKEEKVFELGQAEERWATVAQSAAVLTSHEIRVGKDCTVISTPPAYDFDVWKRLNVHMEVAFSIVDRFYPVQVRLLLPNGVCIQDLQVAQVQTVETERGPIVIPLDVKVKGFSEGGDLLYSWDITTQPDKLAINQPIPEDCFVLPLSMANFVLGDDGKAVSLRTETLANWTASLAEEPPFEGGPAVTPAESQAAGQAQAQEAPKPVQVQDTSVGSHLPLAVIAAFFLVAVVVGGVVLWLTMGRGN